MCLGGFVYFSLHLKMDKFILINSSLNLKEFSDYFFSLVDIIDYHNRDSENVLGGNYFTGDKNGVAVDVQYKKGVIFSESEFKF